MHEVQGDALDVGWEGQRVHATPTAEGGSEGGLAVLARTCIQVTQAPIPGAWRDLCRPHWSGPRPCRTTRWNRHGLDLP
eukprot:643018-Pyramimonas_sp.AAC.1